VIKEDPTVRGGILLILILFRERPDSHCGGGHGE
jgi:hypothetical protein